MKSRLLGFPLFSTELLLINIECLDPNQPSTSGAVSYSQSAATRITRTMTLLTNTTHSSQSENISDYENPLSQQYASPKIDVMTPELASALDRANISSRNATFVLAAAYRSVGLDIEKLNLSYSTIRRSRIRLRENIAEELKDEFKSEDRYTVHWDGKILSDIVDPKPVDRIPIILSTSRVNQLLGVPKISEENAENHSLAIMNTLKEWSVASHIKAMCFDTTAVNTDILWFIDSNK